MASNISFKLLKTHSADEFIIENVIKQTCKGYQLFESETLILNIFKFC